MSRPRCPCRALAAHVAPSLPPAASLLLASLFHQEKFLELYCKEAYACAFLDHKSQVAYDHLDIVPERVKAEDALAELLVADKLAFKNLERETGDELMQNLLI